MSDDEARQRQADGSPLPPALVISSQGEAFVYEINRGTFAFERSAEVFRRHFGDNLLARDTLYVILGSDSGLLIRYLLNSGLPEGSRYLFVEPPEIAELVIREVPPIKDNKRIAVATPQTWEQALSDFSVREYIYLDKLRFYRSLAATDAFYAAYPDLFQHISQRLASIEWQVQAELGHKDFFREQLFNLGDNRIPAEVLKNGFRGQTAMILAGGPSLDDCIPWAKANRDRVTLISVSRISRHLLAAGLQPHVVVSVDPKPVSAHISRQMLLFDPDEMLFAYNYHVNHHLPSQWAGRSVYMGDLLPWDSPLNRPNLNDYGPTVTNAAIHLALHMGFERILLAGVDLCLTREGYSHARDSREREAGPVITDTELTVLTNSGRQAQTRPDYLSALQHLALQAQQAQAQGCRLINPAPESASVALIEHRPLDEIGVETPPCPPMDSIRRLVPESDGPERTRHYQELLKELAAATYRLTQIRKLTQEALDCNDGLFGRNGKQADFKYKKRMDKIERRLDREFKDLSPLVKKYEVRQFFRLSTPGDDRDWTAQEIEAWGKAYYQTYRDSADELIRLIADASGRLESRLVEERDDIRLTELHKIWDSQELWARFLVWDRQQIRDQRKFDPNDAKFRVHLLFTVPRQLAKDDPFTDPVKGSLTDLRGIRAKLQRLFRARDLNGLKQLDSFFASSKGPRDTNHRLLLTGYIAELETNTEEALHAYQGILDAFATNPGHQEDRTHNLLEEALLRIATISFEEQNLANAANALECLSNLSPVYDRQYGELLRISGQTDLAIDAYGRYIRAVPRDTQAMLRLGQLYRDAADLQAARTLFEQVVQIDPNNREALELISQVSSAAN